VRLLVKPFYDDLSEDPDNSINKALDVLSPLKIDVLGVLGGRVAVFSQFQKRLALIEDTLRLQYSELVQIASWPAIRKFGSGIERSKFMRRVRKAIKTLVIECDPSIVVVGTPRMTRAARTARRRARSANRVGVTDAKRAAA
jgi:hypothetical protein